MRFTHIAISFALTAVWWPAPAQVSVHINVPGIVQIAPPAPRYEAAPGPRPGQVWVPGRWVWDERNYAWRQGYWQAARPDYVYAPGRWMRADGGWHWVDDQWRQREHRGDRDDVSRHDGRHENDHHGGVHCPPGQAKKGRC